MILTKQFEQELLSEMDDFIVSDISENEIFVHRNSKLNLAILIDKRLPFISITEEIKELQVQKFIFILSICCPF